MHFLLRSLAISLPLLLSTPPAIAGATELREVRVAFPKNTSGTTIGGRIRGREIVDYKLGARAGQHMAVSLKTDHLASYFNVLAPGEHDVAFFIGSRDGDHFEGVLPTSGDYTVRVYLMRSAARRGETAHYTITVGIEAGAPSAAPAGDGDALVPGTSFHATGEVPCARRAGQPTTPCRFGVEREGAGSGLVTVFWPDGGRRVIFFETGAATGSDASEADGGGAFASERDHDLNRIRIGDERYEIPDAVIHGG